MSIVGVSQVHVSVDDFESAVSFYRDVLGLSLEIFVAEQGLAFFDVGGTRLYLAVPESDGVRSRPLLYFEVDDISAEASRLTIAGVEMLSEPHVVHKTESTELWMTFFKTPEGHINALTQEVSIPPS